MRVGEVVISTKDYHIYFADYYLLVLCVIVSLVVVTMIICNILISFPEDDEQCIMPKCIQN